MPLIDPFEKSEIVQLQEDLTVALQSWDALDRINIVQQRKLQMQSEVDASAIYNNPRNGRAGCGILVEMPTIEVKSASAPGPSEILLVSFAVLEEPNLNLEPTQGTLIDAETVSRAVRRFLHQWLILGKGELYPTPRPTVPAEEWPGLVAYRTSFGLQLTDEQWTRLTVPTVEAVAQTVTLTNDSGNPDADIYYTRDGSMPGQANPGAVKYSGPFTVAAGTVLRVAAWKVGYLPSAVDKATIN